MLGRKTRSVRRWRVPYVGVVVVVVTISSESIDLTFIQYTTACISVIISILSVYDKITGRNKQDS